VNLNPLKKILKIAHSWLTDMPDTSGINSDHDGRYYTETELDSNISESAGCLKIGIPILSGATHTTQCHFNNLFGSAGRATGGTLTHIIGTSNVTVALGTGFIKKTDADDVELLSFDWEADTVSITDNTTYIGIEYHDEGSRVKTSTSFYDFNLDTQFILGVVYRELVNSAYIYCAMNTPWWVTDGMTNLIERFYAEGKVFRDKSVGGMLMSNPSTTKLAVTTGKIWALLSEFTMTAIDTSVPTGSFYYLWYNATDGWQLDLTATDYSVLQWNDITNVALQNLANNKFANIWVYATRTLTSYGTLAGDVWSVVTRTLTGIGTSGISSEANATTNTTNIISEVDANETKIDTIDSNVDSIKLDIGNVTYGLSALQTLIDAIDTSTETTTRFDEIKGAGWTTETLKAIKDAIDAIVDNTDWTASEKEQIRDSLGIDGTKTTAENGQLQDVATEINATSNKDEVITQVNANETKIDTIDSNVDSIIANPDDYKADVSDLATSTEIASLEVLINRILGLSQENFRITVPVYNSNHLLTSATINTYNNAGDCDNNTNQLATYSVIATYNDSGEMQTYKVVKN